MCNHELFSSSPVECVLHGVDVECFTENCDNCDTILRHVETIETEKPTVEKLLTNAPKGCAETAQLYSWATNYDVRVGTPFGVFLDLIGFTAEYLSAEPLVKNPTEVMGYLELDMLADALKEYAERPNDVENFVSALIVAEWEM